MSYTKKIQTIINKNIIALAKEQEKNGNFLHVLSSDKKKFIQIKKYHSIFPIALILAELSKLPSNTILEDIKKKAATFLLKQKSTIGSFNYWARNSQEIKRRPYPDDLDDTFCALIALHQYNSSLIDGEMLAQIVSLLTFTEQQEGGPYRTWIVPETAEEVWKDADIAVNSNIAYFLSLQEVDLPNIEKFIEEKINAAELHSPYYASIYPIIYFISRFYKGKYVDTLKKLLLEKRNADGSWGNVLDTSLAVLSLINLGTSQKELEPSIEYIIKSEKYIAQPYALYIDLVQADKTFYAGASSLTLAFCSAALASYSQLFLQKKVEKKSHEFSDHAIILAKAVTTQAEERFSIAGKEIQKYGKIMLKEVTASDKHNQITLLPFYFRQSLGEAGKTISDEMIISLGLANLYGWIAYTIYDDFLDEEGNSKFLPVANICLRELTSIFLTVITENPQFITLFHSVMNDLEAANAWEVNHCRFEFGKKAINLQDIKLPNYKTHEIIAHKSLGHALGACAILLSLGYSAQSKEATHLISFFKHYLIARQLDDDLHDWEEDLRRGHINPISAYILKQYKKDKANSKPIDSEDVISKLKERLWQKDVVFLCKLILDHVQKAKKSLQRIPVITDTLLLEKLLSTTENSASTALREQKRMSEFLKTYNKTAS